MEIRNLDNQNLRDIVEPCICGPRIKQFAQTFNLDIERVRKRFSEGAELRIDWIKKRVPLGYKAKIIYEREKSAGFIDYLPIEVEEESIYG